MDSDRLLSLIRSVGLEAEFEVRYSERWSTTLDAEKGVLKNVSTQRVEACMVRCLRGGRLGVVRFSPPPKDLSNMLVAAYRLAGAAGSTDTQTHFACTPLGGGSDNYFEETVHADPATVAQRLSEALRGNSGDPLVYSVNAKVNYGYRRIIGANTNGVVGEWRGSFASFNSEVVAKDGLDQASASKSSDSSKLSEVDFGRTLGEAVSLSKGLLGASPTQTFRGMVVVSAEAAASLILNVVHALSGIEVLKGRSYMARKKGSVVGSRLVCLREVVDVEGSPHNRWFDDELVATQNKSIIDGGTLTTYLHNIYSAEKMGEKPTGNGFVGGEDVDVATTNVVLDKGKGGVEDLVSQVKRGVYLIHTGDTPNMASGDLSAMVLAGYYIEDGALKHPVRETMIGVNMIDLLRSVVAVGGDVVRLWGVVSPPLLVDNVQISGRA